MTPSPLAPLATVAVRRVPRIASVLAVGVVLSEAAPLGAQSPTVPTVHAPAIVPASRVLPSAGTPASAVPCAPGATGTGAIVVRDATARAAAVPCAPASAHATATLTRPATAKRRASARPVRRSAQQTAQRARPTPPPVPALAPRRQVPGARPVSAAQLLDAATREYRETGVARPVVLGAVTAFPYGVSDAVVTCGVLRACLIDLEPGERLVTRPLAGDMKPGGRWFVGMAPVGADSASTMVWVKPTDCGLTTNLVLSTDRRVYTLTLESPSCDRGGRGPAAHVAFYFPDSTVPGAMPPGAGAEPGRPAWAMGAGDVTGGGFTRAVARAGAPAEGAALAGIVVDVARLNFDYRVRRDRRFPWAPAQVFDDAVHTFIKIPPDAAAHPAPALFELAPGGGKTLMNYTVRDGFYVVDRTFRRAVLALGQGKHEQRVELENARFGAPVQGPAAPSTPNPERE